MAFINQDGKSISFGCSDLIKELKQDIAKFGGSKLLDVIKEHRDGVIIYKDYNFIDNDKKTEPDLEPGEE